MKTHTIIRNWWIYVSYFRLSHAHKQLADVPAAILASRFMEPSLSSIRANFVLSVAVCAKVMKLMHEKRTRRIRSTRLCNIALVHEVLNIGIVTAALGSTASYIKAIRIPLP